MPTLEERVQALEQEVTARRQTEEMLTIAIRALVSKEAFEKLQATVEELQGNFKESQEQNGKLFNVIIGQNSLHNERVKELPAQIAGLDGKVVGLQTEMRQHFTDLDGKVIGIQTETRQRFTGIETALTQILARLPENP